MRWWKRNTEFEGIFRKESNDKDLEFLKYYLQINVTRSWKGIVNLNQSMAGKLGAKTVESPVEQNPLQPDSSDLVHDTG